VIREGFAVTTTAQINRYPDIPLPPGAKPSEWWDVGAGEETFRCVETPACLIGASRTRVYCHCTQLEDGRVDDGTTEPGFHSAPGVSLDLIDDHGWRELAFHMSSGEARQLAAQLVAAADSKDRVNQDDWILRRLEKIAKHVGADAS
jgi:hypothetical protein